LLNTMSKALVAVPAQFRLTQSIAVVFVDLSDTSGPIRRLDIGSITLSFVFDYPVYDSSSAFTITRSSDYVLSRFPNPKPTR